MALMLTNFLHAIERQKMADDFVARIVVIAGW
jgi:hypothetical protein